MPFNRFICFVLLVPTAGCCVGRFVPTLWLLQLWSPEESFCDARGDRHCLQYTIVRSVLKRYVRCLHTVIQYNMIISVACQPDLGAHVIPIMVPVPIQTVHLLTHTMKLPARPLSTRNEYTYQLPTTKMWINEKLKKKNISTYRSYHILDDDQILLMGILYIMLYVYRQ